ncbi:MAG: hypothetical protein AAGD92_06980 [Pseudomonadota bacterium]
MELIINAILMAASGSAALYCYMLNKKLDVLRSTEKGLGASIATMAKSVEDARTAISAVNESNTRSVQELKPLIEEANSAITQMTELIDVVSELTEIAVTDIDKAATQSCHSIYEHVAKAKNAIEELREEFVYVDDMLDEVESVSV